MVYDPQSHMHATMETMIVGICSAASHVKLIEPGISSCSLQPGSNQLNHPCATSFCCKYQNLANKTGLDLLTFQKSGCNLLLGCWKVRLFIRPN